MFVRWKKRPYKRFRSEGSWYREQGMTYAAYLVESKRIDGKPRQKVIAFLGSIRQDSEGAYHFRNNVWHRVEARDAFLDWMEARLTHIDITDEEKQQVREQVYKVIPPATDEEKAAIARAREISRASLAAFLRQR